MDNGVSISVIGPDHCYTETVIRLETTSSFPSSVCGSITQRDLTSVQEVIRTGYVGSIVTIKVENTNKSNPNPPQYGIRDIKITLIQDHSNLQDSHCGITNPFGLLLDTNCPNKDNMYYSSTTQSHYPCHPACAQCYAATSAACFSCSSGYVFNGTHCNPCHTECRTCLNSLPDQCLSCNVGSFLYANGSCISKCGLPYILRVENDYVYCDLTPCTDPNTFLSLNNNISCLTGCDKPHSIITAGGYKFCLNPCQQSQYIYPDGSCHESCNHPMRSQTENGNNICSGPCEQLNSYYYIDDQTCKLTCSSPYSKGHDELYTTCRLSAGMEALKGGSQASVIIIELGIILANVLSFGDAGGVSVSILSKMVQYIKFLDILYPANLEAILQTWNSNYVSLAIVPSAPGGLRDDFVLEPLPEIFAKRGVHSSFLVNIWDNMLTMLILLSAIFMLAIFERDSIKKPVPPSIWAKIRVIVQSLLLVIFYQAYGDIIFFSIIEMRSSSYNAGTSQISLLVSILMLTIGCILFCIHSYILIRRIKSKRKGSSSDPEKTKDLSSQIMKKFSGIRVLFKDLREGGFSKQGFTLFFVIRDILFSFILAVSTLR